MNKLGKVGSDEFTQKYILALDLAHALVEAEETDVADIDGWLISEVYEWLEAWDFEWTGKVWAKRQGGVTMDNLLKNGGFEADWGDGKSHAVLVFPGGTLKQVENIFTPPGWTTWFRHKPGTWDQPEVRDAWKSGDARRVHGGEKGMLLFTFYRKHDAGYLQQVDVEPGSQLCLTAWAHAWSNWQDGPHPDDGRWSEGKGVGYKAFSGLEGEVIDDNARNFTFYLGIDPTGGTNPFADTVVWGQGAHIYNEYAQVPPVEVIAQAGKVTVFLRSKTLWAFKHNDAYWDDVELVVTGVVSPTEPPEPEEPEETEPVEWNYPVIEKGSKLGVHGIFSNKIKDFAQSLVDGGTHFPVVKAVDDFGWLVEVKKISPKTITIARMTSVEDTCGGVELPSFSLEKYAQKHIDKVLKKIEGDPRLKDAVDYWEVYNEPDPPGAAGHTRLAELMIVTMKLADQHGLKIAIFTFNAGCPEWDEMEAVVETGVFGVARAGGHILTTHEGVFGDDHYKKWFGDMIEGSPVVQGAGALNFRYRYLYYLIEKRGEVVPLVITEWYGGAYEHNGNAGDVVEAINWWDSEARKDYYLWAVCPFTLGPSKQWKRQDYEFAYPALVEYCIEVKDQQNALPRGTTEPKPSPDPKPRRGAPREQYARTYVLLPPGADAAWAHAVVAATWDNHRYTLGGGADDAALGDLDVRNVLAINPHLWPTDLVTFFDTYYPGNTGEDGVNVTSIEAASPPDLLALLSEAL